MTDIFLRATIEWLNLPWYAKVSLGLNALVALAIFVAANMPMPKC